MRILVVEDDSLLRQQLEKALTAAGFVVDLAETGPDGLYHGTEYPCDAAVLDLGLPELDGMRLIDRWREAGKTFPVLVVTARSAWQDKVAGLEAGADDYLVKPFVMEELIARVNSLIRRAAGWAREVFRSPPYELDRNAQILTVEGKEVILTHFEYRLLEYLMLHAGEVISKSVLTEHLYDDESQRDSNVLEVFVGRLRKKLDPHGRYAPIETIRGSGYRFVAPDGS